MLTEGKSGYALKITKAKVKNIEFGRGKEAWPNFTLNSNNLSYDTIFAISKICDEIIIGNPIDDYGRDLDIIAQYFDSAKKIGDRPIYDWDFLLSGATAYFIGNDFGSAKALLQQINKEEIPSVVAKQLFCFLYFVLIGGNQFGMLGVDNDVFAEIRRHFETGTGPVGHDRLFKMRNVSKKSDVPYTVYYIDLLVAVILVSEKNSAWLLLPQFSELDVEAWRDYLVRSDTPRILWSAQKLIGEKDAYKGSNCIIQLPTGTGKTKSIELIIKSAFIANRAKTVVVLAPLRALCFEISRDLTNHFRGEANVNKLSDALLEDDFLDTFEIISDNDSDGKNIIICTPEKLNYIIRHRAEMVNLVDLFVFDEGHMFDDGSRGVEYELLLTNIKTKSNENSQKIFISAVLPNTEQVNEWLFGNSAQVVSSSQIKTTEKSKGFLSKGNNEIRFFSNNIDVENPDCYLPRIITKTTLNKLSNRERVDKFFPNDNAREIALYFAFTLCKSGNVAIYVKEPRNIKTIIETLDKLYKRGYSITSFLERVDSEEIARISNLIIHHYGANHFLLKGIRLGMAAHHSKIENGIKISMENALQKEMLHVITCTSTLTQGVNLPIKYMLITTVGDNSSFNGELMKVREFQNLIGRTARSGMHTEGSVIITDANFMDKRNDYQHGGNYRWRALTGLFDPSQMERCDSTIKDVFENFYTARNIGIRGTIIAQKFIEDYNNPDLVNAIFSRLISEELSDDMKNNLKYNLAHRKKICDSIESYICFVIGEVEENENLTIEQYEELAVATMQQTFAYSLCGETERGILNELARKMGDKIYNNRGSELTTYVARSLISIDKGLRVKSFMEENQEIFINNRDEFMLRCINFLENVQFERLTDLQKVSVISLWLNGITVIDISTEIGVELETAEKLCAVCSYELSYLFGEFADLKNISQLAEEEAIFRKMQRQLKYGLDSDKAMQVYEGYFQDRYIAGRVGEIIGDGNIEDELIAHRDELAMFLMDLPSIFFDKFTNVVGVD